MGCVHCCAQHPAGESCPAPVLKRGASLEGQRHGPLVLRRRLGAGALGTVHVAEYPATGNRFAVKALHPRLASVPAVRARFYAEARAVRGLVHPNVARVLDVRPGPSGAPCLLMEHVDGVPFSRLPLPLTPTEAVELLEQALAGLAAAHAQGLVHGDLRPHHLVLARSQGGERRVKLLDIGMTGTLHAGLSEEERAAARPDATAYTVPLQWGGGSVDARADLFALAAVGYLLVTGQPPTLLGQAQVPPVPPHVLNPCVPPGLSAVLLRALSPRPAERYPDAFAFGAALINAIAEPAPDAELAQVLARTANLVRDPYALLGAAPSVDFEEVHRRAEAALKRLDAFRARSLPVAQLREWESLRSSVLAARRTLGDPLARVGFDAVRGNVPGISRCLAAGLSEDEVEPLRLAFLAARPGVEARARSLFTQGHALEVQRALAQALRHYAEALTLDPLNVAWQRHFHALSRQARAAEPSARPS